MLTLTMRKAIPAMVLLVLETQAIFASFFISFLAIDRVWQKSGVEPKKSVGHPSRPPRGSDALHGNRLATKEA